MAPWVLALALVVSASGPAAPTAQSPKTEDVTEPQPTTDPRRLDWLVVPLANYDSDAKFGFGAAAQLQWAGLVDPYRYQLSAQLLFTTGGVQSHWVRYDAPRFLGTKVRFWSRLEYHRDLYAPYYGPGNASSDDLADHPELGGKYPFRYDRVMPLVRMGASYPLGEHLHVFGFANYKHVVVHPYAGSLLEQQQPYGIQGGDVLEGTAGAYYDTRDHEAVPSRGDLLELSVRGAVQGVGSSFTYGGLTARVLDFRTLFPRVVLALRLEGDVLSAGAPFFELINFGGVDAIDGVGGIFSERGVPQDRYAGRFKGLGTAELRFTLGEHQVWNEPLSWGSVVFLDLGRVYQPGADNGTGLGLHPGYGGGLRVWRRAFVLRGDVASSPDRPVSVYLLFGHFF
jgi:outer membrane protein assembly factor BamA